MKALLGEKSATSKPVRKAVQFASVETDIVFETVQEALVPPVALKSARKTSSG